jgi:hypothetical protein
MNGFERTFKIKSVPKRTPCFLNLSLAETEPWEVTIYGDRLSPAAEMHVLAAYTSNFV